MEVSQYLDIFVEEAKENLQRLNDGLLQLESGGFDAQVIGELFRSAHTLKGMAATMGFEKLASLTHRMESALDLVRQNQQQASSSFISHLLRAVDLLEQLVAAASEGRDDAEIDIGQVLGLLPGAGDQEMVAEASPIEELVEHEHAIFLAAQERGWCGYRIDIHLAPGTLLKAARAYMVFQRLEQQGEVIRAEPPVPELEAEQFGDSFSLWLVSPVGERELKELLLNIGDVRDVRVTPLVIHDDVAATAGEAAAEESVFTAKLRTGKTVRVDISRLDRLMNLMSELVITRTRLTQLGKDLGSSALTDASNQLSRILLELQDEVMKVRMVAVEQIFQRFPRMVRDLSQSLGKEVKFTVEGQETELDRTIIDEIGDPLVHLLRNALDHGIETSADRESAGKPAQAELKLSAYHRGDSVFIEVADDGRGIDAQKVKSKAIQRGLVKPEEAEALSDEEVYRFLFQPGFSTAEQVTDVSGRGVGLDVVASKIQSLGGRVLVQSQQGTGSAFTIILPLTLAIVATLQVRVNKVRYAIPLSVVDQTALTRLERKQAIQGQMTMSYRGQTIPVLDLRRLLGGESTLASEAAQDAYVVVVYRGNRLLGLVVDELLGQEEIVVKPLGRFVDRAPGVSGATILGDGTVALILDVTSLV